MKSALGRQNVRKDVEKVRVVVGVIAADVRVGDFSVFLVLLSSSGAPTTGAKIRPLASAPGAFPGSGRRGCGRD
jgi:hypothetical protein